LFLREGKRPYFAHPSFHQIFTLFYNIQRITIYINVTRLDDKKAYNVPIIVYNNYIQMLQYNDDINFEGECFYVFDNNLT